MANYNRNQLGPHNRRPPTSPARETIERRPQNERIQNYRRDEYYGSPYDVGNYASHYDERMYNPQDLRIGSKSEESRRENFKGKGPRAYKRPDKRILEDVNDRLFLDPYIDASEIEVDVDNGDVILKGTVEDRTAKRLAEDIAETVPGVKNVENRIRIRTSKTNERIVGPVRSNSREELL